MCGCDKPCEHTCCCSCHRDGRGLKPKPAPPVANPLTEEQIAGVEKALEGIRHADTMWTSEGVQAIVNAAPGLLATIREQRAEIERLTGGTK